MDDPNNAGIYKLNTICNDDPDIIPLLNTPAPCAFERDENGVFQQIKDWKPDEDEEDPDMDILKQCQKWHEESKQHKIIDALEAIPAEERTPEMDSELARAYNNLADPHKPTCKEMLKKALALLKPHEEYFEDDYYWNFRMGLLLLLSGSGGPGLCDILKRHWKSALVTMTPKSLSTGASRASLCRSSGSASGSGQRTGGKPLPRWKQNCAR